MRYEVIGVAGIGEVRPGDDIARLIVEAGARQSTPVVPGDLLVIGQKIVSKAEGRLVRLADVEPSPIALAMAAGLAKDAIGLAGFAPLLSYLGERDPAGRPLQATILALADELAGAAEPVMGKLDRIPAAIVRGLALKASDEGSKPLLREPARDLFR